MLAHLLTSYKRDAIPHLAGYLSAEDNKRFNGDVIYMVAAVSSYNRKRLIEHRVAAETRAVPSGKLRINAPVSFGMKVLAPLLPQYMQKHPQVEVELTLANRKVDLIDEGYDAIFRIGDLADSRLIARRLAPYKLVACAAPSYLASHPPIITPKDLVL